MEILDWTTGEEINVTYVNGSVSNIPVAAAVWSGNGGNTTWGNPANWNGGIVPTCNTDVTIPGGLNFYPTVSTPAVCNNITIESGATLIIIPYSPYMVPQLLNVIIPEVNGI